MRPSNSVGTTSRTTAQPWVQKQSRSESGVHSDENLSSVIGRRHQKYCCRSICHTPQTPNEDTKRRRKRIDLVKEILEPKVSFNPPRHLPRLPFRPTCGRRATVIYEPLMYL